MSDAEIVSSGIDDQLPDKGQVVAVIIGIEKYQQRTAAQIPQVEYAEADAAAFEAALRAVYSKHKIHVSTLVNNDATFTNIDNTLKREIASVSDQDLFVFYYAGHGFHGEGGNRITAWDTHGHFIENTTLVLRDSLMDRIGKSACKRAVAFVDACASNLTPIVAGARDVVTEMNSAELADFLNSAQFSALFLSCSPGQKSYPSSEFGHGIWTHFLLKALLGQAEEALGPGRYLTDNGLRDYLSREVPRYLTQRTNIRGQQSPIAIVSASNTFRLREVPLPEVPMIPAGDLRAIKFSPKAEFLEGVRTGRISSLPGYQGSGRWVTEKATDRGSQLASELLTPEIDEEIQEIYQNSKQLLGLKRRDTNRESGDGTGRLDTPYFRYTIESGQDQTNPWNYSVVRKLELREGFEAVEAEIDELFGQKFDRLVVEFQQGDLDFSDIVDQLEVIEEKWGGELRDDEAKQLVTFELADGTKLMIDFMQSEISLAGSGRKSCANLLARARQYRFGLSGPSRLLLSGA